MGKITPVHFETLPVPIGYETVIGYTLRREGPHSHPNLDSNRSPGCTGMGRHVMRPRIPNSKATRSICPFAGRIDEQRGGAVRGTGANGEAARL